MLQSGGTADCLLFVLKSKAGNQDQTVLHALEKQAMQAKYAPLATKAVPAVCLCMRAGKEVSVNMEYNRQVAVGGAVAAEAAKAKNQTAEQRDMAFATVTINEKDGAGQQRANNVCNCPVPALPCLGSSGVCDLVHSNPKYNQYAADMLISFIAYGS